MSRLDRAIGLVRSLAIYHAIPFRQQRLRRFYGTFVRPGDLVFDVGAHAGNRVRAFRALGCRVVALEPQPDFARLLRALFGNSDRVDVFEVAVGATPGRACLSISERTPTVTTLADTWRDARAGEPDFAGVTWQRQVDVETTTLDLLSERFGTPAFVKIDVEGSEAAVLAGLTRPVPVISFEYLPRALDEVGACVARLATIGPYRFNWSVGESYRLTSAEWIDGDALVSALRAAREDGRSGDVYARLTGERPR